MDIVTNILSFAYLLLVISTVVLILTDNNTTSGHTTTWLLVLMVLPVIGLILYYIFGYNARRNGASEKKYAAFKKEFSLLVSDSLKERLYKAIGLDLLRPNYVRLARLLNKSNDSEVIRGSEVEIITSGTRKLNALLNDIRNARHHIHFEYFYFRRDENCRAIRELLMQKAREGVKVRFLYENIANIDISTRYYNKMRKAGVEVLPFTKSSLPWIRRHLNYRDHRKIVVIDGNIGYTGGMNIGNDYFVKWRDTHLRITGNGIYGLQYSFLYAWYGSGGALPDALDGYFNTLPAATGSLLQVVPDTPDSRWPFLLMGNAWAIENAQRYIYIQTPYYLPPDTLLQSLKQAALSGVDVRIMLSHKSDIFFMDPASQAYYEESLRSGIRIYEYQNVFIHAKSMVSDDYLSIVGSANMDFRSLDLSFEINTHIYDEKLALENKAIFLEDMKNCKEIMLDEWLKRPWYKKLLQAIMKLFAPLL